MVTGREGLSRDEGGEQGDRKQWNGSLDANVLQPPLRQRETGQLERVAGRTRHQYAGPDHLRKPNTATSVATMRSGTPAGTNGWTTSATMAAPNAIASGSRARRRGASSARKAAGGAASRPSTFGLCRACVARAPTSVAKFPRA